MPSVHDTHAIHGKARVNDQKKRFNVPLKNAKYFIPGIFLLIILIVNIFLILFPTDEQFAASIIKLVFKSESEIHFCLVGVYKYMQIG